MSFGGGGSSPSESRVAVSQARPRTTSISSRPTSPSGMVPSSPIHCWETSRICLSFAPTSSMRIE
jgi:hypothetical protein